MSGSDCNLYSILVACATLSVSVLLCHTRYQRSGRATCEYESDVRKRVRVSVIHIKPFYLPVDMAASISHPVSVLIVHAGEICVRMYKLCGYKLRDTPGTKYNTLGTRTSAVLDELNTGIIRDEKKLRKRVEFSTMVFGNIEFVCKLGCRSKCALYFLKKTPNF